MSIQLVFKSGCSVPPSSPPSYLENEQCARVYSVPPPPPPLSYLVSQVGFSYPTIPFCPHYSISFVPLPPIIPLSPFSIVLQSFVPPVLCPLIPLSPFHCPPVLCPSPLFSLLCIVLTIPFHCPSIVLLSLPIVLLSSTVHCSY